MNHEAFSPNGALDRQSLGVFWAATTCCIYAACMHLLKPQPGSELVDGSNFQFLECLHPQLQPVLWPYTSVLGCANLIFVVDEWFNSNLPVALQSLCYKRFTTKVHLQFPRTFSQKRSPSQLGYFVDAHPVPNPNVEVWRPAVGEHP